MKKGIVLFISLMLMFCVGTIFARGTSEGVGGKTTVTVQSWQHGLGMYKGLTDDDSQSRAIEEDFKAANPNADLSFKLLRTEDHMQSLRVDFAAGTAPDVIGLASGSVLEEFKDRLEPLGSYAEREWGANWQNKFTPASLSTILLSGDEVFAFPSAMSASGFIWYNNHLMRRANVPVPHDWVQLEKTTSGLRENGLIPLMFGGRDEWQNLDMFIVIMGTINKELANEVFAKQASWTERDVVKAFDYYQKLYSEGIVQDGAISTTMYNEGYSLWRDDDGNSTIPMMFNGSWELGTLKKENSFYETFSSNDISIATFPAIEGNSAIALSAPDVTWAINIDSENKDAAWDFIKWISYDMQQQVVDSLGFFSVLVDSPSPSVELPEDYRACYDVIVSAISGERTLGFRTSLYSDVNQALYDTLQQLAAGQITPQEAGEVMQKKVGNK
ncbi:extracellular solute-binding protein [uncultured Sphaerochaeta sp.]|uniref:ABC transporter substrate-binding protein n=1 Tax=uncultured Sphaerochaeta sp. TaxID=886478 RepID=UPI002A0A1198|nr:extracellular solute-binding protein [uncultured Sphaerochaeta sp.]